MSTAAQAATVPIRITPSVHAELLELQQEFRREFPGATITVSGVIERLLIVRKQAES